MFKKNKNHSTSYESLNYKALIKQYLQWKISQNNYETKV